MFRQSVTTPSQALSDRTRVAPWPSPVYANSICTGSLSSTLCPLPRGLHGGVHSQNCHDGLFQNPGPAPVHTTAESHLIAVDTPQPAHALGIAAIAAAEQANSYKSIGPGYLGTGIAGDLSVEVASPLATVISASSGIGIYLRSDHMAHRYAKELLI